MGCYVIYLKLSIDAQLVLEPFQFVIVQLRLPYCFQMASLWKCVQYSCLDIATDCQLADLTNQLLSDDLTQLFAFG